MIDLWTDFHGHDSNFLLSRAETRGGYQDGGVISHMEKCPWGLKPLRETSVVTLSEYSELAAPVNVSSQITDVLLIERVAELWGELV